MNVQYYIGESHLQCSASHIQNMHSFHDVVLWHFHLSLQDSTTHAPLRTGMCSFLGGSSLSTITCQDGISLLPLVFAQTCKQGVLLQPWHLICGLLSEYSSPPFPLCPDHLWVKRDICPVIVLVFVFPFFIFLTNKKAWQYVIKLLKPTSWGWRGIGSNLLLVRRMLISDCLW